MNREQQRRQARMKSSTKKPQKSLAMRIFVFAIVFIMFLGIVLMCLR